MRQLSTTMQEALSRVVSRALQARVAGDGRPFIVGHFVTNRCMCKCASCLWKDNECEDVPLSELKKFYSDARDEGFVAAAFTGGEPFIRKDLGELARFVKEEAGMGILCFTTGWFLEKRMDEVLPHLDMLAVSVDSADAGRHDAIRGLPGLFDRLVEGVTIAKRRYPELSIQLNTCVQQGMEGEIDDLIDLARDLDVHISFDVITEYRNGGSDAGASVGLPLSKLQEVCAYLRDCKQAGDPILNSERYFDYFARGRNGYKCHLPKMAMFVDGWGNLEYCLDLAEPLGNIRRTSLKELMELDRFKQLRIDAEKCWSCNSPTMVDLSHVWENPRMVFQPGGIAVG